MAGDLDVSNYPKETEVTYMLDGEKVKGKILNYIGDGLYTVEKENGLENDLVHEMDMISEED